MNLLRFSVLTFAFAGYQAASADEPPRSEAAPGTTVVTATPSKPALWSEFRDESSLLPQIESVYRSLRAREAAEAGIEIESVRVTSIDGEQLAANDGNCKIRPRPGSLIMTRRCFYESNVEEAFNQYQFQNEIKQIRELHDLQFLEDAEYGTAYKYGRPVATP